MSLCRWAAFLLVFLLTGCVSTAPSTPIAPSLSQSVPAPNPEQPEGCIAYVGNWPVSFYYSEQLTLQEEADRLVLTAQQGEEATSIEISRNALLMNGFAEDFDFDGDLDALIHQTDQQAAEQGNPFTAAGRLYGCGYPASWFQRQLQNERWELTQTFCFLYRQPEAWQLEAACTQGLREQTDQWVSEIAVSLRAEESAEAP